MAVLIVHLEIYYWIHLHYHMMCADVVFPVIGQSWWAQQATIWLAEKRLKLAWVVFIMDCTSWMDAYTKVTIFTLYNSSHDITEDAQL